MAEEQNRLLEALPRADRLRLLAACEPCELVHAEVLCEHGDALRHVYFPVDGSIALVVGTHALVQEDVEFADLGLAVVDEQHRFGVHQRMALSSKGHAVDLLVMTATPIPRTLMLAAYGDLDVSKLIEKPAGRQPIDTRALPLERIGEVADGVGRQIAGGARVYWVCPLIEESEDIDLANVEERFELLKARFPGKVGLLHGRLKSAEREATMSA